MPITKKKEPIVKVFQVRPDEFEEIQWLWYPYIPAGNATMVFGPGGLGKTTVCCDLAARVTTGQPLPGQEHGLPPQKVLMLSAEDDAKAVLAPRLMNAGADLEKIYFGESAFIIEKQSLKELKEILVEFAVAVVFLDPVVSFMGGKRDMNKMNEVRSFTGPLQDLARETGVSIITVHHSRKGGEGHGYEHSAGSADFINGVRSAIYIHEGNSGEKLFEHVKANLGPKGDAIQFDTEFGLVQWGEVVHVNQMRQRGGRAAQQARSFLQTILAAGPVHSTEVEAMAKDEGINLRTLNRAKRGVAESFATRHNGKMTWFWRLKEKPRDETAVQNVDPKRQGPVPDAGGGDDQLPMDTGKGTRAGGDDRAVERSGPEVGSSEWLKAKGI